jgi:hypothetical protein
MAYAASALVQTENARNAALAAAGKLSQLSLLDFLSESSLPASTPQLWRRLPTGVCVATGFRVL